MWQFIKGWVAVCAGRLRCWRAAADAQTAPLAEVVSATDPSPATPKGGVQAGGR